jgi:hypothetical protein
MCSDSFKVNPGTQQTTKMEKHLESKFQVLLCKFLPSQLILCVQISLRNHFEFFSGVITQKKKSGSTAALLNVNPQTHIWPGLAKAL